ncbi:MAG: zinc ABC transporter substrate-binding protein [Phycisphaerales bacterium]|jgi:zinc/manganese transport system substrate-binding protein|nr:zinc ABC transporter substrate-binding protein [Phycisphaerales bacterium]
MKYVMIRRTILVMLLVVAIRDVSAAPKTEKLRIVTTTTDLKSIAQAIGGEKVAVSSIATGYENPHYVQAKPSFMMLARKADLWIRVGLELEIGYEELIIDGSRNRAIRIGKPGHLDASEKVLRLEVPKTKVTRELGDVHPQGNPHYWLDPLNARIVAGSITKRLAKLSPENAKAFEKNLTAFQKALDERMFGVKLVEKIGGGKLWAMELKGTLDEYLAARKLTGELGGWLAVMRPLKGSKIITHHRSWSYFVNRFGLIVAAELEPKPGVPPSGAHLLKVMKLAKARSVGVILMEPAYSRKAADLVARKTGAAVVVCAISVNGQKEAADYLTLIDMIINRVSKAAGK